MSAFTIIQRAQNAGLKLWAEGAALLRYEGDANTFELMKPELIACKAEIMEALRDGEKVQDWLRQQLDSIQPAASIKAQAVQLGFRLEQLNAARLAIGASVSKYLGVTYWQLVNKIDREAVRDALQKIAAELGFSWNELLDAGAITELDLDQFAIDFSHDDGDQWRCYINSIGLRARHGCPGLAHRITCNCGGKCRAFGEQP